MIAFLIDTSMFQTKSEAYENSGCFCDTSYRSTMTEAERSGKYCEAKRLLQRFLSGAISQRLPEPKMHLTRQPQLQPTSDASVMGSKVQSGPVHIQKEVRCMTMSPKNVVLETSERKTVVKMTKLQRFLG